MANRWFLHRRQNDKASRFGVAEMLPERTHFAAPRPTRHLPTQCRFGSVCRTRTLAHRVRFGRQHMLARPPKGDSRFPNRVIAELLPSVTLPKEQTFISFFQQLTQRLPLPIGEHWLTMSSVRRVRIESTGIVTLERTRWTRMPDGTPKLTLFWAVWDASESKVRLAQISVMGDLALRTHCVRIGDFLSRWTAKVRDKKNSPTSYSM